eukprot:4608850-Pyramimonas_sp.AAC.1
MFGGQRTTNVKEHQHVARPRQAIGRAESREASPRGSVGGGRASSRKTHLHLYTGGSDCPAPLQRSGYPGGQAVELIPYVD